MTLAARKIHFHIKALVIFCVSSLIRRWMVCYGHLCMRSILPSIRAAVSWCCC
jgi:hypothetical protein